MAGSRHPIFLAATVLAGTAILILFGIKSLSSLEPGSAKKTGTPQGLEPLEQPTVIFGNPIRGPLEAKVTIVEFGDFLCEPCREIEAGLQQMLAEFPDSLRLVWKDFPNAAAHPQAPDAAEAARCAQQQGAFWEYHHLLLAGQANLGPTIYPTLAAQLDLDAEEFADCLTNRRSQPIVQRDFEEGVRLRIDATPYLFVNGRRISGNVSSDQLKTLINRALAETQ